jgi:hypothetical protein
MTLIRGGVFTRADARACGYPDPDIDSLLDTGSWRRIRPGTYAPYQVLTVVDERMLHLRRVYRLLRYGEAGLAASHQSAAALHALPTWGLDLGQVHVTARDGRPGRHAGGVHRHVRDPVGPGVLTWNKVRMASPARAVAEVAAVAELAPGVALAEAALYSGLATPAALKRAANQLVRGAKRAHQVLAKAGMESASVAESRLRLILAEAGLPAPSPCPPPTDPALIDEGDWESSVLWFPDERTVVEFEPRFPFPCCLSDDDAEEFPDATPAEEPSTADYESSPEPLEYCWISWSDLDDPAEVVDRIRTTFTRASRRTGVHAFDLARRRKPRHRRGQPGRLAASTEKDLPS